MDMQEVTQLANILRKSDNKVINGDSKFLLSTHLLHEINKSFGLIMQQRDSLNSSLKVNSKSNNSELFSDLLYLYTIVKKSPSLKLISNSGGVNGGLVDITNFKNLKLLELHKVNIQSVIGIQATRASLQHLICNRNLKELKEILEYCGADKSSAFLWSDLKEGVFSYNALTDIDNSLEFAPWLHTLDLSHNDIKCANSVNCLCNLKNLNLSYNKLESVPQFTGQICSRLQVLILKSNFIENVTNVSLLVNLCDLDLSDNYLLEHKSLEPLSYLVTLKWLHLEGNPLSFHPQHRNLTVLHLHVNTTTVRFILDRIVLDKSEQKLAGKFSSNQQRLLSSVSSIASDNTIVPSERLRRVREAVISDDSDKIRTSPGASFCLTNSMEHLETKRQIKELRTKYGEAWLQQQAARKVQDALGIAQTALPITSSPYQKDFMLHAAEVQVHVEDKAGKTLAMSNYTFTTARESLVSDNSVYPGEVSESSTDEEVDLGEGEESIYLTRKKDEEEELFLVLTKTRLSERECISGKENTFWPVNSLSSCEVMNGSIVFVRLEFNTLRRDHRVREYVLESDELYRLVTVLQKLISMRPPVEDNVTAYKCMQCSTKFQKVHVLYKTDDPLECPSCEGKIVIEDDL